MKVAIVGSRNFSNLQRVRDYVVMLPPNAIVISGGARGVDQTAAYEAKIRGLKIVIHYPEWENLGRAAGFIRNKLIVQDADKVVAFWDGQSHGTLDTITYAKSIRKPLEIYVDKQ